MGFSRQEYWSRVPFPSAGDLPGPGIKLMSLVLHGGFLTSRPTGKTQFFISYLFHAAAAAKSLQSCPILCDGL